MDMLHGMVLGHRFYLLGELITFTILKLIFRLGWLDLIGPFLAFTASMVIPLVGAWLLNSWGRVKLTPRQFGFAEGLWFAGFFTSVNCAWFYLAFVLHIFSRQFFNDPSNDGPLLVFSVWLVLLRSGLSARLSH